MKKCVVYTLKDKARDIRNSILSNAEVFERFSFSECTSTQKKSIGFAKTPLGGFVDEHKGNIYLRYVEQKKSPNKHEINSVNTLLVEKWVEEAVLAGREANEDGIIEPNKKEAKVLKETAEYEVLKKTFPSEPKAFDLVFRQDGTVIVEGNWNAAEDILALIRKALGSLPIVPVETDLAVTDMMDEWIMNSIGVKVVDDEGKTLDDKILLGYKAVFYTQAEGKIQVSGEAIDSDECRNMINEGHMVSALEFERDGMISCFLRDTMVFDAIKYSWELTEDVEGDDIGGTFLLQMKEVGTMVDDVYGRLTEKEED